MAIGGRGMNKIKLVLGASILLLVSVQAKAVIYEYTYTGNTLVNDDCIS